MEQLILAFVFAIAGYVAAILTWPRLRQVFTGLEAEAAALRQKAADIERQLRARF